MPEGDELVQVGRRGERDGVELLGGNLSDPSQLEARRKSASEVGGGQSETTHPLDNSDDVVPGRVTDANGQAIAGEVVGAEDETGQEVGPGVGERRVDRENVVATRLRLRASEARRNLRALARRGGGSTTQNKALVENLVDDLVPLKSRVTEAFGGGDDRLVGSTARDVFFVTGEAGELPVTLDGSLRGEKRRRKPMEISDGDGRRRRSAVTSAERTYEGTVGVLREASLNRLEDGLVLDLSEFGTSGLVPLELIDYR